MKDLGQLHYCLGLQVWRDNGNTLFTLLRRFNMNTCKLVSTPLENNVNLKNNDYKK